MKKGRREVRKEGEEWGDRPVFEVILFRLSSHSRKRFPRFSKDETDYCREKWVGGGEMGREERDVSFSCFRSRAHRWRACNWSAQLRRIKTEMENGWRGEGFDLIVLTSALWNLCSWKQKKKKTNVNQWCTRFNDPFHFHLFLPFARVVVINNKKKK